MLFLLASLIPGCKKFVFFVCVQIFRILRKLNVRVVSIILLLCFGAIFYMGASTSPIILFVFIVCIFSFLLSIYLTKWVLAKDEGPPEMVQVSSLYLCGVYHDVGFFFCSHLILICEGDSLTSRYQMLYVMELKVFSERSIVLYPRWPSC